MIRFAIWTAVSTKAQAAEDRVSLADQEERCRERAISKGWSESAGPYVVPGESRTRYINLRDAEIAMPALHRLLEDAKAGAFDVLIMYHFNRLRDLLDPVARVLESYGVQLYSLAEPIEPQPPEAFDPTSGTSDVMRAISQLASRSESKNLRRHYREKMPARVSVKQLHSGNGGPPFGYKKPAGHEYDRDAVLVPDPEKAAILIQAKDRFLKGQTMIQLERFLNDSGVRAPRGGVWRYDSIRRMLKNPFYYGIVRFGVTRHVRDLRTGKISIVPGDPKRMVTNTGLHEPLWDEGTHRRILKEFSRRGKSYAGRRAWALSSLLQCSVCHQTMWLRYYRLADGSQVHKWACRAEQPGHAIIKNEDALRLVAEAMVRDLQRVDQLVIEEPENPQPTLQAARKDLQERLARWGDAFEEGRVPADEYARRTAGLQERLVSVETELRRLEIHDQDASARRTSLEALAEGIDVLPSALAHGDPQALNAQLHSILNCVIIAPGPRVALVWKRAGE